MKFMQDRRSEIRMLCADMLEVRWESPGGQVHYEKALLEDISRSGACLQLERPIPCGVECRLRCRGRDLVGSVKYCVYREIGYFAGLEFRPGSKWSRQSFRPQHLLDLEQLVARTAGNGPAARTR
jgi:hypothetical protein